MKWASRFLLAISSLLFGGCSRNQSSLNDAPRKTEVEVVVDAAEIAEARQIAATRRDQRFKELLADPGTIRSFEREDIDILTSRLDEAVNKLTSIRDDPTALGEKRVQAAVALQILGVDASPNLLAELAINDDSAKRELVLRLDDLVPSESPLPEPYRGIVVAGVGDSDAIVSRTAVGLVARYKIREATGEIAARIRSVSGNDRDVALGAAAVLDPTASVVEALITRLNEDAGPFGIAAPIDHLAEAAVNTQDDEVRRTAVDAIVGFLTSQPDQPWIDGNTLAAVGTLAKLPHDLAVGSLTQLVRNSKWQTVRTTALSDLSKLDADRAKEIADDTGLRLSTSEPAVQDSKNKLTIEHIAEVCVHAGILNNSEAKSATSKLTNSKSETDELPLTGNVAGFLYAADRYYEFDTETGMLPNRHDLLIVELASKSAGRFKPEAVLEKFTPDSADAATGSYEVQFVYNQRLYRFNPTDLGDWYDVGAVLTAVNRALEDEGSDAQFNLLASDGQTATVIFANPAALQRAATSLELRLGDDPDEARRLGVEFEQQVLDSLSEE